MNTSRSEARWESLTIPTYAHPPERRLPVLFRRQGNIYPERLDDILGGAKRDVAYAALVLENEYLRLTIVPELGGKLWSVFDKSASQETLYVPDCIKPGLIAHPGAWIPGGMEFNFPIGHHPRTMRPIPCAILDPGPDQAAAVISQVCRRTGLRLTLHIRLRAGEARFHVDYEALNPTPLDHSWYQWTNVGMLANDDWQFLSKSRWFTAGGSIRRYPVGESGIDNSFFRNRDVCSDTFMVAHREDFGGCYDHGRKHGLAHVAPWRQMRGKKYFTWGRRYAECSDGAVFCDNGAHYVEIQFGPLETQMERAMLAAGQGFSYGETWIPFRGIGGFDWADRDLLFNVAAGAGWLYAAVPLRVRVAVNGQRAEHELRPAQPVRLAGHIKPGDTVELHVNGRLARAFRFPLVGRQEPGGAARARRQYGRGPAGSPRNAPEFLAAARRAALADTWADAVGYYRKSLALAPRQLPARFELADALWHTGDFDAGAAELRGLLKGTHAARARLKLAQRAVAEAAFRAPALAMPEGAARDLALAEQFAGYGGYEAAAALYRRLARSAGADPRVHYGLAICNREVRQNPARALQHARHALKLSGSARDYLVELGPMFIAAGRHREAMAFIRAAPPDVRQLSMVRKLLIQAWFELGEFARCQAMFREPGRLHSWEGDFLMADLFVLSATALAERALRNGDLAAAERWVRRAEHLPATLGTQHRALGYPGAGFWRGAVYERQGRPDDARRVWRATLTAWEDEREARMEYVDDVLGWQVNSFENVFLMGRCALCLGKGDLIRRALRFCRDSARRRNTSFLKGIAAELGGDFKAAAGYYRKHIALAPGCARLARLHLAAVSAGRRRGEPDNIIPDPGGK